MHSREIPAGMQTYVGLEPDFYGLIKFITVINPGSKIQQWHRDIQKKTTTQGNVSIIDGCGGVAVWND